MKLICSAHHFNTATFAVPWLYKAHGVNAKHDKSAKQYIRSKTLLRSTQYWTTSVHMHTEHTMYMYVCGTTFIIIAQASERYKCIYHLQGCTFDLYFIGIHHPMHV